MPDTGTATAIPTVDHKADVWTPLEDAVSRLKTLVSPLTGIASVSQPASGQPDAPLWEVDGRIAEASELHGAPGAGSSTGIGYSYEEAFAAAVGEAAERYCALSMNASDGVLASASELTDAVPPEHFALFRPEQYASRNFPYVPFTSATPVSWVAAASVVDDAPVLVPAQLTHLRSFRAEGEQPIGYSTSSGLACGPSLDEAIVTGLLELVERDALMLTWFGRLVRPLLDWSNSRELAVQEARFFAPTRVRYSLIDLSQFCGVPTTLAVLRGETGFPQLAFGASAALTIERAWKKALCEGMKGRRRLRQFAQAIRSAPHLEARDVRDFDDHATFYSSTRAGLCDFLDSSPDRRDVSTCPRITATSPAEARRELAQQLAGRGISTYFLDLTTADVRAAGFTVVRVIAPQLLPMSVGWDRDMMGGRRLADVCSLLGFPEREPDRSLPHPYP